MMSLHRGGIGVLSGQGVRDRGLSHDQRCRQDREKG
jgi:hypothetical protein